MIRHRRVVLFVFFCTLALFVGGVVFSPLAPAEEPKPKPEETKANPAAPIAKPNVIKPKSDEAKGKAQKPLPLKSKVASVAQGQEDKLPWWPTDAQPAPVKDDAKGGYWWWPQKPGTVKDLWGNRGFAYVNKIIYNWHGKSGDVSKYVQVTVDTVSGPQTEMKASLIVKRTIRDLRLPFKGRQTQLGPEHDLILKKILTSLRQNDMASVLVTSDPSGDVLAQVLGEQRADAVAQYLLDQGIDKARILVVAPGKFQEAGLLSKKEAIPDSLQILIAEVTEVMIPGPGE